MELPGANCLYAMATISITFVGLSALLRVFASREIGAHHRGADVGFTA
jgi:hypothetical protein